MNDDLDLIWGAHTIPGKKALLGTATIAVDFTGTNASIRNTQYGALKIKGMLSSIASPSARGHVRPTWTKKSPDIRIMAHLGAKANITLGPVRSRLAPALLSPGHRRGALKENLAAAMIVTQRLGREPMMMDPMCGSGTLLIEAAFIAADMAPACAASASASIAGCSTMANCGRA